MVGTKKAPRKTATRTKRRATLVLLFWCLLAASTKPSLAQPPNQENDDDGDDDDTCSLFSPHRLEQLVSAPATFVEQLWETTTPPPTSTTSYWLLALERFQPDKRRQSSPLIWANAPEDQDIVAPPRSTLRAMKLVYSESPMDWNALFPDADQAVIVQLVNQWAWTATPVFGTTTMGGSYRALVVGPTVNPLPDGTSPLYLFLPVHSVAVPQQLERDVDAALPLIQPSNGEEENVSPATCPSTGAPPLASDACVDQTWALYHKSIKRSNRRWNREFRKPTLDEAAQVELWHWQELAKRSAQCFAALVAGGVEWTNALLEPLAACLYQPSEWDSLHQRFLLKYTPLLRSRLVNQVAHLNHQVRLARTREERLEFACCPESLARARSSGRRRRHLRQEEEKDNHNERSVTAASKEKNVLLSETPNLTTKSPIPTSRYHQHHYNSRQLQQESQPDPAAADVACALLDFNREKQEQLNDIRDDLLLIIAGLQPGEVPENPFVVSGFDVNSHSSQFVTAKQQAYSLSVQRVSHVELNVQQLVDDKSSFPKKTRKFLKNYANTHDFSALAIQAHLQESQTDFVGMMFTATVDSKVKQLLWPADFGNYNTSPDEPYTRRRQRRLEEQQEEEEEEEEFVFVARAAPCTADKRGVSGACTDKANARYGTAGQLALNLQSNEMDETHRQLAQFQEVQFQGYASASLDCLLVSTAQGARELEEQVLFDCLQEERQSRNVVWAYTAGFTQVQNRQRVVREGRRARLRELELERQGALSFCCVQADIVARQDTQAQGDLFEQDEFTGDASDKNETTTTMTASPTGAPNSSPTGFPTRIPTSVPPFSSNNITTLSPNTLRPTTIAPTPAPSIGNATMSELPTVSPNVTAMPVAEMSNSTNSTNSSLLTAG